MIEDVRSGVATAVNAGLTMLYWRIGFANAFLDEGIVATLLRQLSRIKI